ncbi:MAG: fluoride efflux transporter CrcB [Balneolaceae bacterium]
MQFGITSLLAVGAGGFLGAISRYLLSVSVDEYLKSEQFPLGIFIVNIVGCFFIGLLAGVFELKGWMNIELRLFIFTGFLGGFTTFSTFVNDSFLLGKEGEMMAALLNVGGQVLLGLIFVWLGYSVVKFFS